MCLYVEDAGNIANYLQIIKDWESFKYNFQIQDSLLRKEKKGCDLSFWIELKDAGWTLNTEFIEWTFMILGQNNFQLNLQHNTQNIFQVEHKT